MSADITAAPDNTAVRVALWRAFLSAFAPDEMLALARQAGFKDARIVGPAELMPRYFGNRSDGLHLTNGEQLLVAGT